MIATILMGVVYYFMWVLLVFTPIGFLDWLVMVFMYFLTNTAHGFIMSILNDDDDEPDGYI